MNMAIHEKFVWGRVIAYRIYLCKIGQHLFWISVKIINDRILMNFIVNTDITIVQENNVKYWFFFVGSRLKGNSPINYGVNTSLL